jgi:hypothetical protein
MKAAATVTHDAPSVLELLAAGGAAAEELTAHCRRAYLARGFVHCPRPPGAVKRP